MFKKRGLSTIVATLLILLLVFVAVGILWVVIRNVIVQGTEQVSLGKFTLDLKIEQVSVNANNVSVKIKRNPGEGEISGLKIIISDGDNTQTFTTNGSIKINERKTYSFVPTEIDISKIEKVQIAPVFTLSSGKIIVGDIKDEWEKSSATGIGGVVEIPNEENSNVGSECIQNSNCTGISNSGNYCSVDGNSAINNYNYFCNASKMCQSSSTTSIVENCSATGKVCSSGNCVAQTPQCSSHSYSQCYSNDIYWYNSCNVREEIKTDCSATENCANNQCVAQTSSGGNLISALLDGVPVIHAQTFVIPENSVSGDTVGDLNLMWKGPTQSLTFSLTNNDGGRFAINSNGRISVATENFDYDSQNQRQIVVRATETSTGKYNDATINILLAKTENTIFIDPSYSGTETGSRSQPYNSWDDVNFQPSKNYMQKRGTIFNGFFSIDEDGTSSNHLIVGAYGSGNKPEVDCSSYSNEQGIFLGSGYANDGSDAPHFVDVYSFVVHGCNGIRTSYAGSDLIFRDIEVYDNGDNGGIYIWHDFDYPDPQNQNAPNKHIILEDIYSHDNPVHGIKAHPGGLTMRNIFIRNNAHHGMSIGARYNDIKYVLAYGNGQAGVEIGSAHTNLDYVLTYGNYYGVEINEAGSEDVNVSHVVARENDAHGFLIWEGIGDKILVENSKMYDNTYSGVRVRSATYGVTLDSNEIYGNDNGGISLGVYDSGRPYEIDILNNNIHDNSDFGINVEADDVLIQNNVIQNNNQNIDINPSSTNVQQSGNQVL